MAAALGSVQVAGAGDHRAKRLRKKLKRTKREFQAACAAQPGQCQAAVSAFCAQLNQAGEAQCLAALPPCCALSTDCNIGPALACILAALPDPPND